MKKMFNIKVLILFYFQILVNGQRQPDFGFPTNSANAQQCTIRYSGQRGVCKRYSLCQSAQNDYRNRRIQPTTCYFDRYDPIVCCAATNVQPQTTTTTKLPATNVIPNERISQKKCVQIYPGRVSGEAPIVGGSLTLKDEFPYMTAIGWKRFDNEVDFRCGGFLIAQRFVITAGHCASLGGAQPDVVRIGGDNLMSNQNPNIQIERIYTHPNYNSQQTYNDIAIIQLKQDAFNKPACLWQTNELQGFTQGIAIGYGDTQFGGRPSNDLLKVNLKFYTTQECQAYYKPEPEFPRGLVTTQMCAGDPAGAKDTCQGDSGGPLLVKSSFNRPYIVGLTSFGAGCAGATPSIYTRISSYLDWIEAIVWPQG